MRRCEEADHPSVVALDVDTRVDTFADVQLRASTFSWHERPLPSPAVKRHDLAHYLGQQPVAWDEAFVECFDDRVRGFAAYSFSGWNRRLEVLHMYVDASARGQGVGRALLSAIITAAAAKQPQHVWLETQTDNVPAIRAYERMGFRIVGLDQTLYADHPDADTALYLSRQLVK